MSLLSCVRLPTIVCQAGMAVTFLIVGLSLLGCQKDGTPAKAGAKQAAHKTANPDAAIEQASGGRATQAVARDQANPLRRSERQASAVTPIAAPKLEPAEMPKVVLTEAHASICPVKVGDTLPDAELKNLDGQVQRLSELLGKKLTVVAFWSTDHRYAVEELQDLSRLVAAPYSGYGVNVVGINSHDSADDAKSIATKGEVVFPVVLDEGGKLFAQVATQKLPRTYLLNADGKVLWFDLEYSRTTRRDLLSAIRSQLGSSEADAGT